MGNGCGSSAHQAVGDGEEGQGDEAKGEAGPPLTEEEIQERVAASERTCEFELKSVPLTVRYAYVSQRGYYPDDLNKSNQDALCVALNVCGEQDTALFGVFDGHGATGDKCAEFVRDSVLETLERKLRQHKAADFEAAYTETFLDINERLHAHVRARAATRPPRPRAPAPPQLTRGPPPPAALPAQGSIDDTMSGTTAITCFLNGPEICIANIGDSRAILGERRATRSGERLVACSLSLDQTPYRADERERVKRAGADVLSCDQKEGLVPVHEDWGINLGEDVDTAGDPPRVWERGQDYPGCAFTRSIGDAIAEGIGVTAQPELLSKELTREHAFIVIASDGIFEFITNQGAADIVGQYDDPLEGARAIVAEAYRLWLQYEVRTDDITIIVLQLAWGPEDASAALLDRPPSPVRRGSSIASAELAARLSANGSELVGIGLNLGDGNRPVRRGLSKEKKSLIMATQSSAADDDAADGAADDEPSAKSDDELRRIAAAVKTNFLFAHLDAGQRRSLFLAMKRVPVRAGEVVIRQGDPGEWFYVVDSGEFAVSQRSSADGGSERDVHIFTYKNEGGVHHCFGELALMYSKPRAATVVAQTDGVLWAMARGTFRRTLLKSSAQSLTRALRAVDILASLSTAQLQRLQDILTEVRYDDGAPIIAQGDAGQQLFIIAEGAVVCTRAEPGAPPGTPPTELIRLGRHAYFGERALLHDAPRAATVTAVGPTRCLCVGRHAFEEVLGPLQSIIDADAQARERQASEKRLEAEAAGLTAAAIESFGVLAVVKRGDVGDLAVVRTLGGPEGGGGQHYTLRSVGKRRAADAGQLPLLLRERELLARMPLSAPGVCAELLCLPAPRAVHALLKSVLLTSLEAVMGGEPMAEAACVFHAACLAQALHALHAQGIAYRNLSPEFLMLDQGGYVQLADFRLAKRLDGRTYTTCGAPEYLVSAAARALRPARPPAPRRAAPRRAARAHRRILARARRVAGARGGEGRGPRRGRGLLGAGRAGIRDAVGRGSVWRRIVV